MRLSDRSLIVLCVAGICVVSLLLLDGGEPEARALQHEATIGTVTQAHNGVRRRPAKQLAWEPLGPGDSAYDNDTVFVPPGADAVLYLADGSRLSLEPNSLIVLQAPGNTLSVQVERGGVVGETQQQPLTLRSHQGALQMQGQAHFLVGEHSTVDLFKGHAAIGSTILADNEGMTLGHDDKQIYPARLVSPTPGQRLYQRKVRFSWTGPGMARVSGDTALHAQPFELDLQPGQYTWTIVDAGGKALAPVAPFAVTQDAPPVGVTPRDLELIARQRYDAVPFAWTRTPGADHYVVELSTAAGPLKSVQTSNARVWVTADFPDGVVYWRVRAEGADRPPAVSQLHAFRFSHAALPDAPEVYDPEVDLGSR